MPDTLEVHVNRPRPNDLEVPELFVADQNFAIEIVNGGKPAHVHLHLDDDLAEVMTFETGNHFIPREDTHRLPVRVAEVTRPVRGKLHVSTGYGSETRFIELRVVEPSDEDQVVVDEELSTPSGKRPGTALTTRVLGEASGIALVLVAVLALLVAGAIVGSVTSPLYGVVSIVIALLVVAGVYAFL